MTATIVEIQPFRLKWLEKEAAKIIHQVVDYREVARLGGPVDFFAELDPVDVSFTAADTAPSEMNPDSGDCA